VERQNSDRHNPDLQNPDPQNPDRTVTRRGGAGEALRLLREGDPNEALNHKVQTTSKSYYNFPG